MKPKNARDIKPAVRNAMGTPLNAWGTGAKAILSRIAEKRIIA
ncbi:unnamed protein product, partial [marine sediment metagenome]